MSVVTISWVDGACFWPFPPAGEPVVGAGVGGARHFVQIVEVMVL